MEQDRDKRLSGTQNLELGTKKPGLGRVFSCDSAGSRTQDPLLKREVLYQLSYRIDLFM